VDTGAYHYQSSYKSMARLKPEHAQDELLFERLAGLTNLSPQEFVGRFGYLVGMAPRPF
jgi:hypothetical protein